MNKGLGNLINKINEPRGHWLEKAIVSYQRSRQWPRKHTGFFNPSSCGKSTRLLYLDYAGLSTSSIDDRGLDYMDSGNWAHKQYASYFEGANILVAEELPIRIGPPDIPVPISGRTDAILRSPSGEEFLVDVKGTNAQKISTLKHPEIEVLTQWVLYSWIFMVPKGGILYVNRSVDPSPSRKVFDLENDDGSVIVSFQGQQVHKEECLLQNTVNRMLEVYNNYKASKIPPRCGKCILSCEQRTVCDRLDNKP